VSQLQPKPHRRALRAVTARERASGMVDALHSLHPFHPTGEPNP
jgi:hypothetical protein